MTSGRPSVVDTVTEVACLSDMKTAWISVSIANYESPLPELVLILMGLINMIIHLYVVVGSCVGAIGYGELFAEALSCEKIPPLFDAARFV